MTFSHTGTHGESKTRILESNPIPSSRQTRARQFLQATRTGGVELVHGV